MSNSLATTQPKVYQSEDEARFEITTFGFWVYILSDTFIFATLFATYAVLHTHVFGGPSGKDVFSLSLALTETLILLTSSFTCGLGILAAHKGSRKLVLSWFTLTLLLGLSFVGLEVNEFSGLVAAGHSWQQSAFLSSYFTLVGTHGLHVTLGSLWMFIMLIQVATRGLTTHVRRRLTMLSLFWHFLDIIWIFIFTLVYLFAFL